VLGSKKILDTFVKCFGIFPKIYVVLRSGADALWAQDRVAAGVWAQDLLCRPEFIPLPQRQPGLSM